jgi:hypothetical protein
MNILADSGKKSTDRGQYVEKHWWITKRSENHEDTWKTREKARKYRAWYGLQSSKVSVQCLRMVKRKVQVLLEFDLTTSFGIGINRVPKTFVLVFRVRGDCVGTLLWNYNYGHGICSWTDYPDSRSWKLLSIHEIMDKCKRDVTVGTLDRGSSQMSTECRGIKSRLALWSQNLRQQRISGSRVFTMSILFDLSNFSLFEGHVISKCQITPRATGLAFFHLCLLRRYVNAHCLEIRFSAFSSGGVLVYNNVCSSWSEATVAIQSLRQSVNREIMFFLNSFEWILFKLSDSVSNKVYEFSLCRR